MKILLLICGCVKSPFDEFEKTQKATFGTVIHPNVKTVFMHTGTSGWVDGQTLEVDCSPEYFDQHWRDKLAFDAVWDMEWDIIFRAAASSYVNQHMLYEVCKNYPTSNLYTGYILGGDSLPCIDWGGKIIKQMCVAGSGVFTSRDVVDVLRKKMPKDAQELPEDVLTGRLLQLHGIEPWGDDKSRVDIMHMSQYRLNYHYRFKSNDRLEDIENMKRVHERHKAIDFNAYSNSIKQ